VRIFLCGEDDFAGRLALLFALYHRHSYAGCKPAITDALMGMTALMADYLGTERSQHIRRNLVDLISVAELVYGGGSPIMEEIAIYGNYDLNSKKDLARELAGIKKD